MGWERVLTFFFFWKKKKI